MDARTACAENHGDQTPHQSKTREKRTVEKFKRILKRVGMCMSGVCLIRTNVVCTILPAAVACEPHE